MTQLRHRDFDAAWRHDSEWSGWHLPPSGQLVVQFAGIRYIRAMLYEHRIYKEAWRLKAQGIEFKQPAERELWTLYAVMRGWC